MPNLNHLNQTGPVGRNAPAHVRQMLRMRQMIRRTGLDKHTIYRRSRDPDDDFPEAFRLGPNALAWDEAEVNAFLNSLPRASEVKAAGR